MRTHLKTFYFTLFIKRKLFVKVIFLRNQCLDLIFIHHVREMTRCLVDFNFPRTISLGWTPSGVLGSNSLPRQKNVSTRYHGPDKSGYVIDFT